MASIRTLLLLLPLCALSACVDADPPASAPGQEPGSCRADQFSGLVGQGKAVLRDMKLPESTRIIGPHDPVTMDFRATRLNFEIGEDGRIAKIGCY